MPRCPQMDKSGPVYIYVFFKIIYMYILFYKLFETLLHWKGYITEDLLHMGEIMNSDFLECKANAIEFQD